MPPNTTTTRRLLTVADNGHAEPRPRANVRFDDRGEIVSYQLEPTDKKWNWAWRCWLLAPTLSVYEALLRGDKVPVDQLDPDGVERLWKRPA